MREWRKKGRKRMYEETLNHTIEIIRLTNILELDQLWISMVFEKIFYDFDTQLRATKLIHSLQFSVDKCEWEKWK